MKYTINGIEFNSQEAVKDYCRKIRDRITGTDLYDVDPGVTYMLSGEDKKFLVDFIRHHHNADELIGCGIAEVLVCVVMKGKFHWGFSVLRIDASEEVFGFGKFGAKAEQVVRSRTTEAFRNAIKDQTIAYKEEYFDGHPEAVCEATGEIITRVGCHVDHECPTFKELTDWFFNTGKPIDVFSDGLSWHIADESLRLAWQEYHRENANLRCTTIAFNLSRMKNERVA